MVMDRLFSLMAEKKASDIFLAPGSPIHIKINGMSIPVNQQKLDADGVERLLQEILTERQWQEFLERRELNAGYGLRGVGSFRINVFRQRGAPACVVRYIPSDIPALESLNLPPLLSELVMEKRGLILVVGSTGSGKSTTLASMLDHRNEKRSGHILTFEDPIEFVFRNKRSIVNQRQIGTDTDSLGVGLKNAMRQAPDCILIGEIRDVETMSAAIAYAQSGHLVLSTLHANNANNALNRIISFYQPENRRVMMSDLAATLRAIVSQRLVRNAQGARIPAVELLLNTRHVAELIEQGQLTEVKDAMEKSLAPGSQTFEQALVRLVRARVISREDAITNADSPTNLLWLLENDGGSDPAPASGAAPAALPTLPGARPEREPDSASFSEFLLNI
ncbi:PilT/PilU family type 4a pilus ATPase [Quisquiliibacterium transsilvanicum]|uniref:Twitching motility protein PilU n=1 Tax=Quisquiliibacterium transsilvanicum TaxID=1549638 RepID=A0A7W8HEQ5_9BURK|nr:PilT/PilU family type 4a pilus ATPase [Quisquiliibacterium transsilvanicum]MBB5270528.1 twitching motility protein PilU [Quisquiliibacterium transsilvanicum]